MKIDPFTDSWRFFAGQQGDEAALGAWRWLVVAVLVGLLVASILIAVREWRSDRAQRSGRSLVHWALRVLVGCMWYPNTLWKLPFFSEANGLHYWAEQETTNAAFGWLGAFIKDVLLRTPVFYALDIVTFFLEMAFAISLILGFGVRIMGLIGVVFVGQLWLGLYRNETEWPWTYVFLMMLMGLFALDGFGRSLGVDAWLRRRFADRGSGFARLFAATT